MEQDNKKEFISPTLIKILIFFLFLVSAILLIFDFFYDRYSYFKIEKLDGFYAFYGFIAFSIIIFGSKALRYLIKRPENFYGSKAIDSEEKLNNGEENE